MIGNGLVGVLLAAGASTRFGSPKQLLPLGDTTLLGQAVRNANDSVLERVVVVLGRSSETIRESIRFGRSEVVDNRRFGTGCASSLLAGLSAAGECDALMLLLADQPGVTSDLIDHVASSWLGRRSWAAVTSYQGAPGHPFLFAREAFAELRKLHGDKAHLPNSILYRDKMGFAVPLAQWLRQPLREISRDTLNSEAFRATGLFDSKRVNALLDEHQPAS